MKWLVIVIFGLSVLFSLIFGIRAYIKHAILTGSSKVICESAILNQNEAIQKEALDKERLDKHNKEASKQEREVIVKYNTIRLTDKSCEKELKEIKNALSIFHANPP